MLQPGQILTINLTTRQISSEPLPADAVHAYLGGRGLNAWQMEQIIDPAVDPLGPENTLLLTCGLLTGSAVPASARLQLAARSPQTGLLGASNIGGHTGAALRAAGWQMVRLIGAADAPVYLRISADGADICDAGDLWGLSPQETADTFEAEQGISASRVLAIGPAGENLVTFACVNSGDGHAAGRTGMGAVLGSKRVKAIAFAAKPSRTEMDATTKTALRDYALNIRQSERYDIYATSSNTTYINWSNDAGVLGTRNFQDTQFEHADRTDGRHLGQYTKRHRTCHHCPVHCRGEIEVKNGRYSLAHGERPDIEPLMMFGARLGIDNMDAILYLFNLVNKLGLDVISAGGVLGFAIECFEKGLLTEADTGGLTLTWGDADPLITLLEQIAQKEGLGAILAHGTKEAARQIGPAAEQYAIHSKGLDLPGYDPRGAMGTALAYAISNRGADYTSVYPTLEFFWDEEESKAFFGSADPVNRRGTVNKGILVRYSYLVSTALDALGICKVPILSVVGDYSLQHEADLVNRLTGLDFTPADLLTAGERILNAERRMNIAYGLTVADDTLPERFLKEPSSGGDSVGMTVDLPGMVQDFYAAMGWDEGGVPPENIPPPVE